jgi:uncharacterized cupin superfamily protein
VHSREGELFYVLEGEFDVYVGDEALGHPKGRDQAALDLLAALSGVLAG